MYMGPVVPVTCIDVTLKPPPRMFNFPEASMAM